MTAALVTSNLPYLPLSNHRTTQAFATNCFLCYILPIVCITLQPAPLNAFVFDQFTFLHSSSAVYFVDQEGVGWVGLYLFLVMTIFCFRTRESGRSRSLSPRRSPRPYSSTFEDDWGRERVSVRRCGKQCLVYTVVSEHTCTK